MPKSRLRNITVPDDTWHHYVRTCENLTEKIKREVENKREVHIELCCGKGDFICNTALQHPDVFFIGIDYARPVLQRAVKCAAEYACSNLVFVLEDIHDVFNTMDTSVRFGKIFINFPDPWPKTRHHKRRIVSKSLLNRLSEFMHNSSELIIVTDHDGYAEWIHDILEELAMLYQPVYSQWYTDYIDAYHTSSYMQKAQTEGRKIKYFVVKKAGNS